MSIKCDVLVVGSGVAGPCVARATAKRGLKTILVEKDPVAGMNIQCAESMSKYLFSLHPFKIPNEQLRWELKGMRFWAEDVLIPREGDLWGAYNVDREKFDAWLCMEAIKAGAKFLPNTKLVDIDFTGEYSVKKAYFKSKNGLLEIQPKYLVAADGANSVISRRLGVRKVKKCAMGKLVAYDIKNLKLAYPRHDQIFLGDFAPGSYAYIMPKSNTVASMGVGTTLDLDKDKLEEQFANFLELDIVKDQVKDKIIIDEKSGEVPVDYLTERWVYGNVFLVGDAATQNIKPFVEGISPSLICGDILGNMIAQIHLDNKNYGNKEYKQRVYSTLEILSESDLMIDIIRGEGLHSHDKRRHLIHLALCAGMPVKKVISIIDEDYNFLRKELLKLCGPNV